MGQSVLAADERPLITNPIVEKAIRKELKKTTGELAQTDLEKVSLLSLDDGPKITVADLKELAKCTQLTNLDLLGTKVTKAGVTELKKALPNCEIEGP